MLDDPVDDLPRLELDQLKLVAEPTNDRPQGREELAQALGPVDAERLGAVAEVVRLEQTRKAQEVVGVQVGEVNRVDVDESSRALHLALGALAAIEEEPVPAGPDENASGGPARAWHRAAGS